MNRLNSKRNLVLEKCLHYWPICSTTLVYLERPNSYFMWPKVFHFEESFIEKQMLKFLHKYALTLIWIGKSLLEKYRLNLFCCGMCLSLSQVHWHYLCNALHRHYFVSNVQCLSQVHWHYLCNALHRHYCVSNAQCLNYFHMTTACYTGSVTRCNKKYLKRLH